MKFIKYVLHYSIINHTAVEHQGPCELVLEDMKTDEEAIEKASNTKDLGGLNAWVKIRPHRLEKITYKTLEFGKKVPGGTEKSAAG